MAELALIAPREIAAAIRLAGVTVRAAGNAAEALAQVEDIRGRNEVELVLLPEHFLAGFDGPAYHEAIHIYRPYFVPIPMDWQSSRDARAEFQARLGRILGCHISLNEQLLARGKGAATQ
jgi:vacuolar-type H+-ATPase subunit F/Vma7